jgi:hypothetical protein
MKTGLPMFDTCRAYGLALIVERLAQKSDTVEDVTITDMGTAYLINGPPTGELFQVDEEVAFDGLFTVNDSWCSTLLTTGRTPKAERLKPASQVNLQKKVQDVQKVIFNFRVWLKLIEQPVTIELRTSSGKGFESLPGSLDVSASKGIRRAKLNGYSEGEQLFVPEADWAISLFGNAHFVRSSWAGGDFASLLAMPQFITMSDQHNLKSITEKQYLCSVSTSIVAAHYAIQLVAAIQQNRSNRSAYANRYSNLVVQTMTYSGNQWKPSTGTIFPLQYPMMLIESNLAVSDKIFDLWNHLFRWGGVKGNEALALTLAEFLGQPSLKTFEEHAKVHLRMTLTKEQRRKFSPYQEEWIKEVLRYVQ